MAEAEAAGEVVRMSTHAGHDVAIHDDPPPPPPCVEPSSGSQYAVSAATSEPSSHPSARSPSPPPPPKKKPDVSYPHDLPVRRSATTIQRVPGGSLRTLSVNLSTPIAVAIGPYHHDSSYLQEMEEAKKVARDEFCRVAGQPPEAIKAKIDSLADDARKCYGDRVRMDSHCFTEMMFMDGCFLLQFMACMCPSNRAAAPPSDGLWAKVHAHVDAIARDVMLLENQLPWLVLKALMECAPGGVSSWPVPRFLNRMASAFCVGNDDDDAAHHHQHDEEDIVDSQQPPLHLLGLFHRRMVGPARTHDLSVPRLSSLSSTALELAEMGVKITATKDRIFGNMTMTKRRHRRFGLFGELALAPVLLSGLTGCWLFNMVAHEACLGATCADNFAVSSYISVVSMLMNRQEDVQELRQKGIVISAICDEGTLDFFQELAPRVRVGYRYYEVFQHLQEYRRERWLWIAVHGFLYRNLKTIIAVLSAVGVLAGLFKTILSLKQPAPAQRG